MADRKNWRKKTKLYWKPEIKSIYRNFKTWWLFLTVSAQDRKFQQKIQLQHNFDSRKMSNLYSPPRFIWIIKILSKHCKFSWTNQKIRVFNQMVHGVFRILYSSNVNFRFWSEIDNSQNVVRTTIRTSDASQRLV